MSKKLSPNDISKLVDDLGVIKAQAATLAEQEKAIKAQLIASGQTSLDGDLFHASISTSSRDTLDMDAVRAKLSPQFIAAHTKSTPVVSIRVTARSAAIASKMAA